MNAITNASGVTHPQSNGNGANGHHGTHLLAIVAHELRNPLLPILNGVAVLRHRPIDAQLVNQTAGIIERQARVMSRLIDDLLTVSSVQLKTLPLNLKQVSLYDLIRQCAETMTPLLSERRQTMTIDLTPEPTELNADTTRICQVLQNLVMNAAKFSERGAKIRLRARREGDQAVVTISDSGIGIDPTHLESIFELFVRGQQPLSPEAGGGMGIGLYLVRSFVEAHGGTVAASSAGVGQGSTFTVRLPCLGREALSHAPTQVLTCNRSVSFLTTA